MTEQQDLSFRLGRDYSADTLDMLDRVQWGTEGILFRIRTIPKELERIPETRLLELRDAEGRILACFCLLPKWIQVGRSWIPAVYQFLLAVDPDLRGRGYGRMIAQRACDVAPELIADLRRNPPAGKKLAGGGILYAMVETENLKSQRLFESLAYVNLGGLDMLTFSRLYPKPQEGVRAPRPEEIQDIILQRIVAEEDLAFCDRSTGFDVDHVLVLEREGRVLAGLQWEEFSLSIQQMPGAGGWLAMNLIPRIPVIRRLIDPRNFHYLRFGNIWYQDLEQAEALMEHALALKDLSIGLIGVDPASAIAENLRQNAKLGPAKGLNDTRFNLIGKPLGLDPAIEGQLRAFHSDPSPLDN